MAAQRVLICGFSENHGGMESYIMEIYRHCDREKLQFDFINVQTYSIAFADEIEALGGHIYYIPLKSVDMEGHYKALDNLFSTNNYVGVYYQCNRKLISLDVFKYAKKYNVPKRVIHSHNSTQAPVSLVEKLRQKNVELKMDSYVTHYFACSEEAGKWMFGKRPFTVIKNSVDANVFYYNEASREQMRKQYELENKIVVGTVGRLVDAKNPMFMLKIFDELQKNNPETIFLHVGDGVLMEELKELRDQYDWKDKYLLVGNQSKVADFMNAMDVFVLPSIHEGFPIVLVEAQATGLQCLAADNITTSCDLTGNMQFLPIENTEKLWAEKILEVVQKPRKSEIRRVQELGYDIVKITAEICDFFREDKYAE